MRFKIEMGDFEQMMQNMCESEDTANGVILHNLEVPGLDTDHLVEALVLFLAKHRIDFAVLEIKREEPKANKYLESSSLQQSNLNMEENAHIEQIYSVIEWLDLDKETQMLIQQQINLNDAEQETSEELHNSKNELIAGLLQSQVEQVFKSGSQSKPAAQPNLTGR